MYMYIIYISYMYAYNIHLASMSLAITLVQTWKQQTIVLLFTTGHDNATLYDIQYTYKCLAFSTPSMTSTTSHILNTDELCELQHVS